MGGFLGTFLRGFIAINGETIGKLIGNENLCGFRRDFYGDLYGFVEL